MVDKDTVIEKLSTLKKHLQKLRKIGGVSCSVFKENEDLQQLAAFNLQNAIQNCIDIGSHVYADLDIGAPGTYSEIFYELANKKIISGAMLKKIIQMIGLRNRIAHDYADITQDKIYLILKNNLKDFELFIKHILKYINR